MSQKSSDLLERFRSGDSEAFSTLVEDLAPRLKGFFLRQGAQPSTAEDLTQHVFLRVFQSIDRYQPSGRLDGYFLRIARNLWIDSRRKKRPISAGENLPQEADDRPSPVALADVAGRREVLRAAMETLEEGTRELLDLAILQDLPYKEVSTILEIPVGTVKSRVFYALRKLRRLLEGIDPSTEADL